MCLAKDVRLREGSTNGSALGCSTVQLVEIGSLASGRSLFRVRRHGRRVSYVERVDMGGQPIRDIAQLADGRIALLSSDGKVLFLSRAYAPYCGPDAHSRHVYAVDCPD